MRLALVEGQRVEATPKARGICINPRCASLMTARCGRVKVWHWAHKGTKPCDPWYESETQWHRNWKNKFPLDWQEVIHTDSKSGEVHIADVKNPFGLVIEFQHSPISPEEMRSREVFYGEMVWVVDGKRGGLDWSYFRMGLSGPIQDDPLAYQVEWWGRGQLLRNWSEATAKVYLDFGEGGLWRLVLYDTSNKVGVAGPVLRDTFIEDCLSGTRIHVTKNGPALPAPLVLIPKEPLV